MNHHSPQANSMPTNTIDKIGNIQEHQEQPLKRRGRRDKNCKPNRGLSRCSSIRDLSHQQQQQQQLDGSCQWSSQKSLNLTEESQQPLVTGRSRREIFKSNRNLLGRSTENLSWQWSSQVSLNFTDAVAQGEQQQQQQQQQQQLFVKRRSKREMFQKSKSQRSFFGRSTQNLSWQWASQESLDLSLDEGTYELRKPQQLRRCSLVHALFCHFPKQNTSTGKQDKEERNVVVAGYRSRTASSPCFSESTLNTTGLLVDEAEALLADVKKSIAQQQTRQASLKHSIDSDQELARARHVAGNDMGAVLSMRKVHKNGLLLQSVKKACKKLIKLRDELEMSLRQGSEDTSSSTIDVDFVSLQTSMDDILDTLHEPKITMPSDKEFLEQLQTHSSKG